MKSMMYQIRQRLQIWFVTIACIGGDLLGERESGVKDEAEIFLHR